jgi:DNA-binding NarL/FixJ family response regulator
VNILYVENHAVFAANATHQFLSFDTVTVVPTIDGARGQLAVKNFDLLLVDYDLDDGKGDQLIREIRASGNITPIIGVSSHDQGNKALSQAGASAICSKMQFENIQKVIKSVMRSREV